MKKRNDEDGALLAREIREIVRELPVRLTQEEKLSIGSELARETQELQRALDRKQEISKQLAADVELHKNACMRHGGLLAAGYEYRRVDCTMELNRVSDQVVVVRNDTGEVVERRPLRPGERQAELPI